jgi:hypothetical protein
MPAARMDTKASGVALRTFVELQSKCRCICDTYRGSNVRTSQSLKSWVSCSSANGILHSVVEMFQSPIRGWGFLPLLCSLRGP